MSSEFITLFMFGTMLVLLFTGQRVFGVIGFVGSAAALWLWGQGSFELPFNAAIRTISPIVPSARPPRTGPNQTWNMRYKPAAMPDSESM